VFIIIPFQKGNLLEGLKTVEKWLISVETMGLKTP
jgi:hypothetical protein